MKALLVVQSGITIAGSIVLPFYIILLHQVGTTVVLFAALYALFTLAASGAYLLMEHAVRFVSYRTLLIVSNLGAGLALLSVPSTSHLLHLAAIQIILGTCFALQKNIEKILLAEATDASNRVRDIGRYHALLGIIVAVSIVATGWLIDTFSLGLLFYIGGSLYIISALLSSYIRV